MHKLLNKYRLMDRDTVVCSKVNNKHYIIYFKNRVLNLINKTTHTVLIDLNLSDSKATVKKLIHSDFKDMVFLIQNRLMNNIEPLDLSFFSLKAVKMEYEFVNTNLTKENISLFFKDWLTKEGIEFSVAKPSFSQRRSLIAKDRWDNDCAEHSTKLNNETFGVTRSIVSDPEFQSEPMRRMVDRIRCGEQTFMINWF